MLYVEKKKLDKATTQMVLIAIAVDVKPFFSEALQLEFHLRSYVYNYCML